MWAKQKQPGFTIVELLIVIVVIGILAAITIVAYNNVQGRARVASIQSNLEHLGKMSQLYQIDNDTYPITDAGVKKILQDANQWQNTRTAAYTYLFCSSNTGAYAVISLAAPGIPSYSTGAGTTVYYWSSEKGLATYVSGADNNWTPQCNLAVSSTAWRQISSNVN